MLSKCKQDEELQYMEEGSKAGKVARNYFSDIIDEVSTKFELCRGEVSQWQNSGMFVSYFWCQLKRKQYENSNISLLYHEDMMSVWELLFKNSQKEKTLKRFLEYCYMIDVKVAFEGLKGEKTKGLKAALKFAKEHDMCMTEAQIQGANNT